MKLKKVKKSLATAIVTVIATLSALSIFNARYYLKAESEPDPAATAVPVVEEFVPTSAEPVLIAGETAVPIVEENAVVPEAAETTETVETTVNSEVSNYEDDPIFTAKEKHVLLDAAYDEE